MRITRDKFLAMLFGAAAGRPLLAQVTDHLVSAQESARVPSKSSRIRDVEIYPYSLQQKQAFKIALQTPLTTDNVFVRLRTEEGVSGVGESSPYSAVTSETQKTDVALARSLAELINGRDAFAIAKTVDDMDAVSPQNPSIKAAFEMALWDICGKIAGQPVYRLLGQFRDRFETDKTVFIGTPQEMAEAARRIVAEGFRTIKVKVGESPKRDVERVRAVREAAGGSIAIRIDANQGWTVADAARSLRALEPYDIQACEQPVPYWDLEGLKYVREHAPVPVMADESVHSPHDAIEIVRRDAVDLINVKLMKSGGILNAVRIAQIADAAGVKCMVGSMAESSLALTAAAHVIASQKNVIYADLDSFLFNIGNPILRGIQIVQGVVSVPSDPGLGVDIDPAFLKTVTAV